MSSQISAIPATECPAVTCTVLPRTRLVLRIVVGLCVMVGGFSQLCRGLVLDPARPTTACCSR